MEETLVNAETVEQIRLIEMLMKGGVLMIPLFLLSFIALIIFIEKWILISQAQKIRRGVFEEVKSAIYEGDVAKAVTICRNDNSMVSRILMVGINNIGNSIESIKSTLEDFAKLEIYYLEKRLSFISIISGAAPMVGFLGTVLGMISAFFNLSESDGVIDLKLLSGGIYEALITTATGLTIGIITYFMYNFLVSKVSKSIYVVQTHCVNFIEVLKQPAE